LKNSKLIKVSLELSAMSKHLLRAQDIADIPVQRIQHQFNSNAVRHTQSLSDIVGLSRLGLHVVTLEPGRDSTTHHYHDADEEFIYILSGNGSAKIGDQRYRIGAGDFMGFPAQSAPHSLHNDSDQALVYLMGGECAAVDVVHYPDIARSMIRSHGHRSYSDWQDIHEVEPRER
jgi:uncharacterized cupin superfamily protein